MGCITSKVMSKSISFKEELSQSIQRRSNSISSLEELIISGNKSDHFLALLCSANKVENKLETDPESNTNPKSDTAYVSAEDIETWELATIGGKEKQSHTTSRLVQSSSSSPNMDTEDLARRSQSCHWFPEYGVSFVDSFNVIKEDGAYRSKKIRGRARSIHTVEEYDEMMEKIWLQKGFDGEQSTESSILSSSRLETNTISPISTKEIPNVDTSEAQEQKISEKGLKRKAVAKGLESLSLPQTIEFPSVGSLKDWLQVGGQVYSPGAYVTPKFGSYSLSTSTTENTSSENVAFNPDLVAAFEDCMQQLMVEEETVLTHIVEGLEGGSTNDEQEEEDKKEEIVSQLKDIEMQI